MRILLANMPQMLRGIITDIVSADPLCEIVADPPGRGNLRDKLDETHADVVILAAAGTDNESDQFGALLARHPATRIIAIASGGDRAFLYDLRPHVTPIDELSPAALLGALKGAPPCRRGT
jgi:chemotaxis response regulator CheB